MILYFSGTGNSRYAAKLIGMVTDDKILSMNEILKRNSKEVIHSKKPFTFVCPTYAWRIPKIIDAFIKSAHFTGSREVYFILTCGTDIGNAAHYAKRTCAEKGLDKYINLYNLSYLIDFSQNEYALFKNAVHLPCSFGLLFENLAISLLADKGDFKKK